jgi:hypothetical protein
MSWDATLSSPCGRYIREWNYTSNTNRMVNAALTFPHDSPSETWWRILDGLSGEAGRVFLQAIILELESDPERFRGMNPTNGWGDYDTLLIVLRDMRDAVPDWPTTWEVTG